MALRRALFALGLRYRVCTRPERGIPNKADIVFRRAKVAVEVRGCFWHGCPTHYQAPKTNSEFWARKVEANLARDRLTRDAWTEAGWLVLDVWEHEDMVVAAESVAGLVRQRMSSV